MEDEILQLLSSATGSLLDNIQLMNTLDASKTTWEQGNQSLQVCPLARSLLLMPLKSTTIRFTPQTELV